MNYNTLCKSIIFILVLINGLEIISAQVNVKGVLKDAKTGDPLIGATVIIKGTNVGTITDYEGAFIFKTTQVLPLDLEFRYSGYGTKIVSYSTPNKSVDYVLEEESIQIEVVEVTGQRISDKQKSSPLTVESMDLIAIK